MLMLAAGPGMAQQYDCISNIGWKFQRGDDPRYKMPMNDDSQWQSVTIPHDWSILTPTSNDATMGGEGGYRESGTAWYRARLNIPESMRGKLLFLYCEGIYMNSEIYVNGRYAGGHKYGYSSFYVNLRGIGMPGKENVIAVKVDNSQQKNSRWYSGSGIYRHMYLVSCPMVHMDLYEPFVYTKSCNDREATICVEAKVINETPEPCECKVDFGGYAQQTVKIDAKSSATVSQDISISNPKLWSPDAPNLYEMAVTATTDGQEPSTRKVKYGIRTFEYSASKGLTLNGKEIILNGACVHHDNGIIGAMGFGASDIRKVQLLKDGGFNAVRTSHNPPSPYFLSACDSLGLVAIDEAFDGWRNAKNPHDYSEIIDECWRDDLAKMILRDRSHPSIFCWSIGNEILERKSDSAVVLAHEMHEHIMGMDKTRPMTQALASWDSDWDIYDPLAAEHEIIGYNYLIHKAEDDHKRVPGRVIMQTESFPRDAYRNYKATADHPYVLGDFVWTGIDYLGESGLGRYFYEGETEGESWMADMYPWHGSYCGEIDLTGRRKPISHYRSMLWNKDGEQLYMAVKEPDGFIGNVKTTMWSVHPTWESWTWPGMEGKEIEVEVISRYPRVQLFMNGKMLEEKTVGDDLKAVFKVKYQPGTITAKGLGNGSNKADKEVSLKTAGKPSKVKLVSEKIASPSDTIIYYTAYIVDKDGNICPNADNEITFIPGNEDYSQFIGTGSADLKDPTPLPSTTRKAWKGRAMAFVRVWGDKPVKMEAEMKK